MRHQQLSLTLLIIITVISLLAGLMTGELSFSFIELWDALWQIQEQAPTSNTAARVLEQLRIPRVFAAFITGGLLAMAGALMQMLVRNPLADPYVLGISGGASVGALLAILLGLSSLAFHISTWLGAVGAIVIVFGLSLRGRGQQQISSLRLVLTGVVLASGWGAIISFILTVSPNTQIHGMLFWLMGDLAYAKHLTFPAIILLLGLGFSMLLAKSLNILSRGVMTAKSLGVDALRLQYGMLMLTSVLTAAAVSIAGSIGFIGLIIPHLLRLAGLTDHRWLLPGCVLAGGSLLVLADALSRVIIAPLQVPVGILTAMLGIPIFFYLMYSQKSTGK